MMTITFLETFLLPMIGNAVTELGFRFVDSVIGNSKNSEIKIKVSRLIGNKKYKNIIKQNFDGDGYDFVEYEHFLRASLGKYLPLIMIYQMNYGYDSDYLTELKHEFRSECKIYFNESEFYNPITVDKIFESIVKSINSIIEKLISDGVLSAHDYKMMCQINEIKNLILKTDSSVIKPREIFDFEKKYMENFILKYGYIFPQAVNRREKIEVDKIYITPEFSDTYLNATESEGFENYAYEITLQSILLQDRIVVLGDPGAGKSTLINKLSSIYKSRNLLFDDFLNLNLIPLVVTLRNHKFVPGNTNIMEWILSEIKNMQIIFDDRIVEMLISTGRAFIIFDGLDELIDTYTRRQVVNAIEMFCNTFDNCKYLCTSRKVGYHQAPLSDYFDVFYIQPFSMSKVREYSENWFKLLDEYVDDEYINNFCKEIEISYDLARNPLTLGLICSLYKNAGYIPKRRGELYENCAKLLFESWDRQRGISAPFSYEDDMAPILSHVSFYLYNQDTGTTVDKIALKHIIISFLHDLEEDINSCEKRASNFIDFCTGRAWVFTDVGLSEDDEPLYEFVHRSFLEFFVSQYITNKMKNTDAIMKFLLPKISKAEWFYVSLMACQTLNLRFMDAADEVIKILIRDFDRRQSLDYNIILFALKCCEFFRASTSTVKVLLEKAMILIGDSKLRREIKTEVLRSLLSINQRYIKYAIESIDSYLESIEEKNIKFPLMCEMLLFIISIKINKYEANYEEIIKFCNRVTSSIAEVDIKGFGENHKFLIKYVRYNSNISNIKEFLTGMGTGKLFDVPTLDYIYSNQKTIIEKLISELLEYFYENRIEFTPPSKNILSMSEILVELPLPLERRRNVSENTSLAILHSIFNFTVNIEFKKFYTEDIKINRLLTFILMLWKELMDRDRLVLSDEIIDGMVDLELCVDLYYEYFNSGENRKWIIEKHDKELLDWLYRWVRLENALLE